MWQVETFTSGPLGTNSYLFTKGSQRLLFDCPPGSFEQVISPSLDAILITHSHWDHIGDCHKFREKFDAPLYIHSLDLENLRNPGSDGLPSIPIEGVEADHLLDDSKELFGFELIHAPGHSPGSVCFYSPEDAILVSGDVLFRGGMGNLSLPTAEPERMRATLARLAQLPPQTRVLPGHGEETTIGNEDWLKETM